MSRARLIGAVPADPKREQVQVYAALSGVQIVWKTNSRFTFNRCDAETFAVLILRASKESELMIKQKAKYGEVLPL